MTPPISSPLSNNSFPSSTASAHQNQDENSFPHHPPSPWAARDPAIKKPSSSPAVSSAIAQPGTRSSEGPLSNTNLQQNPTNSFVLDGWTKLESNQAAVLPPRASPTVQAIPVSPTTKLTIAQSNSSNTMREPVALSGNVIDPRQVLTTGSHGSDLASSGQPRNSTDNRTQDSKRRTQDTLSVHSLTSGPVDWTWEENNDPDDQEQALFEQRLCEDIYGVAVRKINQNGKSTLRYVKCCSVDAEDLEENKFSSSRSLSSRSRASRGFSRFSRDRSVERRFGRDRSVERSESGEYDPHRISLMKGKKVKVLTWGKKKDVKIPLGKFVCVRKGKTTDRSRRNACPSSRILSLITEDSRNPSLDIEAPTRLDRDKFAKAFSRFLGIPLEGEDARSIRSDMTPQSARGRKKKAEKAAPRQQAPASSGAHSTHSNTTNNTRKHIPLPVVTTGSDNQRKSFPPSGKITIPYSQAKLTQESAAMESSSHLLDIPDPQMSSLPSPSNVDSTNEYPPKAPNSTKEPSSTGKDTDQSQPGTPHLPHDDERSAVSSLTGAGYDQEIVEELHLALTDLRAELEDSRAEAARAVKVAEQAIQSAENSGSKDWNSTVTHKAAEAAAQAQKRSAEAMAKARMAQERLESERKHARIWRKQAEAAEEEAGHWQTRAAAAEVERATIVESLKVERNNSAMLLRSINGLHASSEVHQKDIFELTLERNRALELELEMMRQSQGNQGELSAVRSEVDSHHHASSELSRKKAWGKKPDGVDGATRALLSGNNLTPSELPAVPDSAQPLAGLFSSGVLSSRSEIERLRSKLAMETAARRKLLHEVQDLRGTVRVYCRPRKASKGDSILSMPSNEVMLVHRERSDGAANKTPLSFEFDGVLDVDCDQQDLYNEIQVVCLSVMDGYNVCVMAYGPSGFGKTYTMLGDVEYIANSSMVPSVSITNFGIHLRAAQQIFSLLDRRRERYHDTVTLSIVEVHNERLSDLLAGTEMGETNGTIESSKRSNRKQGGSQDGTLSQSSKPSKLEIKTNRDGETMVHGLLSVEVKNFEDVMKIWKESLSRRSSRLSEQGLSVKDHEANSHTFATLKVISKSISTGVSTLGKIQFVDLASSNLVPKPRAAAAKRSTAPDTIPGVANNREWKYSNKSMSTLNEVVTARSQFNRSVPYRNSTITHLLSDSLEADTKVVAVACVGSDLQDLQETATTLKLGQKLRKVVVGKATKHSTIRS